MATRRRGQGGLVRIKRTREGSGWQACIYAYAPGKGGSRIAWSRYYADKRHGGTDAARAKATAALAEKNAERMAVR